MLVTMDSLFFMALAILGVSVILFHLDAKRKLLASNLVLSLLTFIGISIYGVCNEHVTVKDDLVIYGLGIYCFVLVICKEYFE